MRVKHWQVQLALLTFVCVPLMAQKDYVADTVFKGSTLAPWQPLGPAKWSAQDGQIQSAPSTASSGFLLSDGKYQDVRFYARVQCKQACNGGVLFRAAKTKDGGLHGILVSLADMETYEVTVDASGEEVQRTKLPPAPPEITGIGAVAAPPRPASAAPVAAAPPRNRRKVAALGKPGEWNTIEIIIEGGTLNGTVNDGVLIGGAVPEDGYGSVALYAGTKGEMMLDHVGLKDVIGEKDARAITSAHFTRQKISDFYYGWSAVAADTRKSGKMDVIAGPFIYMGPDYVERKRYRDGRMYNPSTEYAPDMVNFAYDFNGDGWPDIIASDIQAGLRPLDLYINPQGESRRWTKSRAVDKVSTELVIFKDIDGDGKPEIIFGAEGRYAYAKPDPQSISAPWKITAISEKADRIPPHGLGVGDINGDGRMDLVVPAGWYEHPAVADGKPWVFHESSFGGGGGEMGVYDVNGDGLPDVVTSLEAHGFGLAWFEQKRVDGKISFVRHDIAGDYSTKNAGDVTFSQPHAVAFADMDGDGIPDMVVGKSMWHHLETWGDVDPYGTPAIYVYRTVRDKNAPGGARFVPELVDNHSGVGSAIQIVDVNHDGAPDILTQSVLGTFVFYGKPGRWPKVAVK